MKKEEARGEPERQLESGKPTKNNQELISISQEGSQIQVERIIFYNELLFLNFGWIGGSI